MKYLFWSCIRQIEIRNYNQSSIFQISVCKTVSVLPLAIFESVVALTGDFVAVLSFLLWLVTYYLVWFLLAPSHLRATCVFLILLLSIQFIPFSVSFMGIYTNKFYWEQIESIYHICFKKTSFTSRFQKAWSSSVDFLFLNTTENVWFKIGRKTAVQGGTQIYDFLCVQLENPISGLNKWQIWLYTFKSSDLKIGFGGVLKLNLTNWEQNHIGNNKKKRTNF